MDANKEIKKVFELFSQNKFKEAQDLNNQILEHFPSHIYAKRYQKILANKVKITNNTSKEKEKSAKVRGKSLKCSHCVAKIPFSGLNIEQRTKIKKGNYNNLEIKCPYCHTKFILQKRKATSILGIKIGDIANIDGKKYRATGYVEYKGYWHEDGYSDVTNYLEWILLGEDNSYYYFSEGYSIDEGSSENEFELSKKVIPDFKIPSNGTTFTTATVKSIYGENSKNYVVGEKTKLYEFNNSGKSYVKEVEGVGSQKEAGIYETKSISGNQANKIFGKENKNLNTKKSFDPFFLIFIVPILIFSVSSLLFVNIFNYFFENKQKVEISELNKAKKVELKFKDFSVMKERQTSSTRYDYGGVRTYYSKNTGLKFSVKNDEDKKILEKIQELESENKIKKMFNGDLFKLK